MKIATDRKIATDGSGYRLIVTKESNLNFLPGGLLSCFFVNNEPDTIVER